MLFNSIEFAVFLPIVFALYWLLKKYSLVAQNLLLLLSSYVFYGWWDARFLILILISSLVDFYLGLALKNEEKEPRRKMFLWTSIIVNIGMLAYFKYANFFIESFSEAFTFFGNPIQSNRLNIVLPVGISFYTFQTLSYTIDVYKKELKAETSLINFMAFVSFFPQLVAGPIERASNLLPQFKVARVFKYANAVLGLRQILWGLFKKIVIADNCAIAVNEVFLNYDTSSGSTLFLASILFAFQIYGDFSGYSDIAIGIAKLFGFSLMKNFSFPYFSRDIAEFWRRWHISLSTWFRDYVYIPLGGSRGGLAQKIKNTMIIFIVSGFWHGANWTFIVWGFLNALYFLPLLIGNKNKINSGNITANGFKNWILLISKVLLTFFITCLAWIFFRSENVTQAFYIIQTIFSVSLFQAATINFDLWLVLIGFIAWEWINRNYEFGLGIVQNINQRSIRFLIYYFLVLLIITYAGKPADFIYFQF